MNIYTAMVYAKSPRTGLDTNYFVGYVSASNLEEAIRSYEEDNMPWVTVIAEAKEIDVVKDIKKEYTDTINPREIVKDMNYDDFMDWLSISEGRDYIESAIKAFSKEGDDLLDYVLIMKQFLKDKYGDRSEE